MTTEAYPVPDDYPTWQGPAGCAACGRRWIAIAPVGVYILECPYCHSLEGMTLDDERRPS